jgi:hypothetical protein
VAKKGGDGKAGTENPIIAGDFIMGGINRGFDWKKTSR